MREGTLLFLGESLMPEALVYIVFFSVSLVTTTFLPPTFSVWPGACDTGRRPTAVGFKVDACFVLLDSCSGCRKLSIPQAIYCSWSRGSPELR
jgi:hypothetical protein